jgi:hypothetical protein
LSGQPTTVTSRRSQHELLRSWSGWPLTSILLDPTEVAQVREAGWSGTHHRDPETGERIVGTADGLGFGVDGSWRNPVEVIPWAEVEAIARAVPDDVREQLVAFRGRWRDNQSAYPRFVASAAAVGCGPIVPGEPLTPRQEAYVRELEAFEASGVLPAWEQQRAVLEAERLDLHARALSLEGAEAGDLLELLEDQQVGQSVATAAVEPMRPIGEDRARIAIAEVRRTLPVGSRVQVIYLNGQREQTTPDVRTVTKQTSYEMVTAPVGGEKGSHLGWSGQRAERDANGVLIIRDADGTPFVAYMPLADGSPEPTEATLPIDPALELRYTEARRTTDAATLDDMAGSEIALNRRTVAENSATSPATLDRLAADEDLRVRRAVAGNPNTPAEALDRLAGDPDEAKELGETKVRWLVANNPRTAETTLARMVGDPDAMVLAAIGRHPHASAATLEHLASTPAPGRKWVDADVRQAVASNPNTPPRLLAGWENADGNTMAQVAKNPATPADVLERMSRDTSTGNHTRALAATNPSLPAAALYRLAHEEDAWVREHAAKNPNIDAADSHRVALDQEPKVRRALARNEHVDPGVLTRLQADPDAWVRVALAKNPSIPPETLQALLNDANPRVQEAVEQNPTVANLVEKRVTAQRPGLLPPQPGPRRAEEVHQAASGVQVRAEVAR